jgi:hypothetical protein
LALVLILKSIDDPTLTLTSEEKPWIDGSPAPAMSQTEGSVPGLLFSQTIGFEPLPHGVTAWTGWGFNARSVEHTKARVVTMAVTNTARRLLLSPK